MLTAKRDLNNIMTLNMVRRSEKFKIAALPFGEMRSQLIRMGILDGDVVECVENLPGGTVVIKKNRQEIAIGHKLAQKINILSQ